MCQQNIRHIPSFFLPHLHTAVVPSCYMVVKSNKIIAICKNFALFLNIITKIICHH